MYVLILISILVTSFVSGILGMAGGMILMGVLSILLPVLSAMILHGITQMASNGYRAFLLRDHIKLRVVPSYLIGAGIGLAGFFAIGFIPSKGVILILIGIFPVLMTFLPKILKTDILNMKHSILCGFLVTIAQILAGASGPILDIFFVNSSLNRYQIIATKAFTQTIGHLIKVAYFGYFLISSGSHTLEFHPLILPLAILCGFTGTTFGKKVLDRLSELQFQRYSRAVITVIGCIYLAKGILTFS